MNETIKINNHGIIAKEYKGQRVVTFKDIDTVHERTDGTAGRNFRENRNRFIENEDYFILNQPDEIRLFGFERPQGGTPKELILITEQGYLMLVKSLTDDLAWKVQRELVNTYFRYKKAKSAIEELQELQNRAILEVNEKVDNVEKRVDYLENDIPMYGSESDEMSRRVKKKGVEVMGGKKSNAYKDRKLQHEVYTDIYNQIKREFGLYDNNGKFVTYKALKRRYISEAHTLINNYIPPKYLEEKINNCNAQMNINEERSA